MKLYKVTDATGEFVHKETVCVGTGKVSWEGTQSHAGVARREFEAAYKELPAPKRPRVTVEEVDVPTSKAALLAWLNEHGVK